MIQTKGDPVGSGGGRATFFGFTSPNPSNSSVEPDMPSFPSSRLTAKEVRPKVRRTLDYSGPWLKYHDARPASKFTFLKRLSRSFRRDSMLSSGRILQLSTTYHRR